MPETPGWELERQLWQAGASLVLGVDEAGRGCLAGPVTAAAVMLPQRPDFPYRDSKELRPARRAELAAQLRTEALAMAVGWASAREVDQHGILAATHLAAQRALKQLQPLPADTALVTDWLKLTWPGQVLAVAKADRRSFQVAAASILAKTERDEYMERLALEVPGYGFEQHRGYGTPRHLRALDELGPCSEHRLSFAPVRARKRSEAAGCTIPA